MVDLVVYMNTIIMNSIIHSVINENTMKEINEINEITVMNDMNRWITTDDWYGVSALCYYIICGFILHAIYIDIRSNRRVVDGYRRETIYMYENNDYVVCFIGCFIANLF